MYKLYIKRVLRWMLSSILFSMLLACNEKNKEVKVQKSFIVTESKNTEQLYFSGEIKPIRETAIAVPMDAKIKTLAFSYGSRVLKGEVLAELDSPQQQKEYDEALTSYLKAKDDLDVALAKFSGTQSLWKEKLVSENMFKSDKSTLFTNRIAFFQAKAKLVSLAKKLKNISTKDMLSLSFSDFNQVQTVLNKSKNIIVIKAPHNGIALEPPKTQDSQALRVGSAMKASEVLALIGDLSGLAITIKVPEVNIDKIKAGMSAEVTGIAFPNMTLKAVVKSINAQANTTAGDAGGLPIFTAKVVVPKLTRSEVSILKVGMSASVNVILKEHIRMMVPIKAVNLQGDKAWVMLKLKEGNEKKVIVKTGISTSDSVQIISGIKAGDNIIWMQ